jgi:hypothetical protein
LQDKLAQAKETSEQLIAESAARAEQIAVLQDELVQAKQIARETSIEADARIEQIKRETDERTLRIEADTEERLARAHAEIEGTFARLEAELAVANQRAERAEYWLSRIRDQIESDLIPSFTATLDVRSERSYRKS